MDQSHTQPRLIARSVPPPLPAAAWVRAEVLRGNYPVYTPRKPSSAVPEAGAGIAEARPAASTVAADAEEAVLAGPGVAEVAEAALVVGLAEKVGMAGRAVPAPELGWVGIVLISTPDGIA